MSESEELKKSRLEEEERLGKLAVANSKKAFAIGATTGLGVAPGYRALRLPVKASFISMAVFGGATYASENAIVQFARRHRHDLPDITLVEERRNWLERIQEHRFAVISGVVGTSVLGAAFFALRRKNTSGAQKFMDIRLYGQMAGLLAIGVLIGLSHRPESDRENRR